MSCIRLNYSGIEGRLSGRVRAIRWAPSVLVLAVSAGISVAQTIYVPLNHWSYEFVERMEAKGLVSGVLNSTRPFSRLEMTEYLLQLDQNTHAGQKLNATEQDQLQFLEFEFREEFVRLSAGKDYHYETKLERFRDTKVGGILPGFLYRNNRNMFSLEKDQVKLFLDPVLYQDWLYAGTDTLSRTEKVFERTHGIVLWGQFGKYVGFYFDARDTKEWGSRSYPLAFDISLPGLGFVNGYGSHIWHDETVAYTVIGVPAIQVMLGKDKNYWGPGYFGGLSLSDNATSYDQIKLQARFWRLKFTYFWGFLRTFPVLLNEVTGQTNPKNIVGHRLDIDVADWLDIGFYETVIFGDRRFELAYLNPINFYRSAEHFLGDNDNATLGIDFDFLLIPNVKLYGEIFVDDLFTTRIGSGWFGNKVGFLAGGLWADAFTLSNLDLRAEYARTRPYVYSHERQINTYSHFSTGLGHWIGPNSDLLNLRLQYRFSRSLRTAVDFESFRHGANEAGRNVGGDLNQAYAPGDESYIGFLEGELERCNRMGIEASYEILRNLFVNLRFTAISSENVFLPTGERSPANRSQFVVGVSLNK